jgi:hypothetical protein
MTYKYTLYIPPSLSKSGNSEYFNIEANNHPALTKGIAKYRLRYESLGFTDLETDYIERWIICYIAPPHEMERAYNFIDQCINVASLVVSYTKRDSGQLDDVANALWEAVENGNPITTEQETEQ